MRRLIANVLRYWASRLDPPEPLGWIPTPNHFVMVNGTEYPATYTGQP